MLPSEYGKLRYSLKFRNCANVQQPLEQNYDHPQQFRKLRYWFPYSVLCIDAPGGCAVGWSVQYAGLALLGCLDEFCCCCYCCCCGKHPLHLRLATSVPASAATPLCCKTMHRMAESCAPVCLPFVPPSSSVAILSVTELFTQFIRFHPKFLLKRLLLLLLLFKMKLISIWHCHIATAGPPYNVTVKC